MNQKQLDRLAWLLRVQRPATNAPPLAWEWWADTVKTVAQAARTLKQEAKFLRDSGHSE